MPELPEVEAARRFMERVGVGRRIVEVVAVEQGTGPRSGLFDDKVICEESASSFATRIQGRDICGARRKGKQLWLELDGVGLVVHNGMTGALVAKGLAVPQYKNAKFDDEEWPPKFAKLELVLSDGTRICYCDSRRFGRVLLRDDPLQSPPICDLAPDPVAECPGKDVFAAKFAAKKCAIKAVLLDQKAVVCGVGNWMADELLYLAGVHPATIASELDDFQVGRVRDALIEVCRVACDADADAAKFPPSWLFHHRWANQTSGSKPSPLGQIHFATIGGRTTAFVPSKQKKMSPPPPPPPSPPPPPPSEGNQATPKRRPRSKNKRPRAPGVPKAAAADVVPRRTSPRRK
ncbi:hypothetical protein CTAYLR_004830 [Chrysophaeum taylorii]|uniref:Formamidopyrimidine-DNA glycosylase catalytic domain-containing protein n=1 Tax=Chrysophaeum taylorii TaxID=2483200 RepID=A0AAD7UG04_9STRA|nr:hypothetical protein CTAYLR_004830 [Chrysophaeum taylorii]